MIRKFKIFENSLYSLLKGVDKNEEKLTQLIGFDFKYEIDFPYYKRDYDFTIYVKEKDFIDLVGVDEGVFNWCFRIISYYSDYDYYVDDTEINYIYHYFSDENERTMRKLTKLLDTDIDINSENVGDLFEALGDLVDSSNILYEVSTINTEMVKNNVKEAFEKVPFEIDSTNKSGYDFELEIQIEKIGEYIEKNKLKDINTIKDLIEKVDFSDFSYELENYWESNFSADYEPVQREIQRQLEKLIEMLEGEEAEYQDPNQLSLFPEVDEETAREIIKQRPKKYKYQYEFFSKLNLRYFDQAKKVGGKILEWFKSYEFQKSFMEEGNLERYRTLEKFGILHPIIEYEYGHLVTAAAYNL